jgi:catechol 2,3-dioxygenase-like lactoylglutathione lyase family enzyme
MQLLDHVSIGVPDLATARPFYDAVMDVLGALKVYDRPHALGYGEKDARRGIPPRHVLPCIVIRKAWATASGTGASRRRPASRSTRSTRRASAQEDARTALRGSAPTIIPLTTPPSSSTRPAIAWKRCAIRCRNNASRLRSRDKHQLPRDTAAALYKTASKGRPMPPCITSERPATMRMKAHHIQAKGPDGAYVLSDSATR